MLRSSPRAASLFLAGLGARLTMACAVAALLWMAILGWALA